MSDLRDAEIVREPRPEAPKRKRDRGDRAAEHLKAKKKRAEQKEHAQLLAERVHTLEEQVKTMAKIEEEYAEARRMIREERKEKELLQNELACERRERVAAEAARDRALGRL